jgi:perosamine synthetase
MRFEEKGYNYKMPNLNAALGASQMETINKILKFKKTNYNKYRVIFNNNKYFEVYKGINKSTPNHWLVTLLIKKNYIQYKDLIIKFLISKKIGVRPAWDTMTSTKYLKNFPAMKPTIDNQIVKRIINLPSSAFLHKFFK